MMGFSCKSTEMEPYTDEDGVDDRGTLSYSSDAEDESEISVYPAANIKIDRAQFSIFEMKRRYDGGSIKLDPDFQRNNVWNKKQKSELIESVIMGIPLPLLYLAETMDSKLVIVDGRQRLSTFFDYMNNKFAVSGLRILPELNGCKFCDLEADEKKRKYVSVIEDFQLVVQIIKYPTPDRVRFDIFDRVNRGGTPLNNQEMRNALYQGKATKLLNILSQSSNFLDATGHSISATHMKDKYIILRAISFFLYQEDRLTRPDGKKVVYRSDIEEFLGYSMEYLNHAPQQEIDALEDNFKGVMDLSFSLLGQDAFRIPTAGSKRRPVSMTLFESLFYFFSLLRCQDRDYSRGEVQDAVENMLEDSVFLQALTYNVDSAVHVEERFAVVKKIFGEM